MRYPIMNNSEGRGVHVYIFYTYMHSMPHDRSIHIETTYEKQVIVYICVCVCVLYRISGYEANLDFISSAPFSCSSSMPFSMASTISNYQFKRSFIYTSVSLHSNIGKCQRYFADCFISNQRFARLRVPRPSLRLQKATHRTSLPLLDGRIM